MFSILLSENRWDDDDDDDNDDDDDDVAQSPGRALPCDVITFFILVSSRCSLVWRGVIQCSEGRQGSDGNGDKGRLGDSSF
jgi:hypothetical protein